MVNKTEKKVWNLPKAFSLRTIKVCRFEIIDSVMYIYCIKHAYRFLSRAQVGFVFFGTVDLNMVLHIETFFFQDALLK